MRSVERGVADEVRGERDGGKVRGGGQGEQRGEGGGEHRGRGEGKEKKKCLQVCTTGAATR